MAIVFHFPPSVHKMLEMTSNDLLLWAHKKIIAPRSGGFLQVHQNQLFLAEEEGSTRNYSVTADAGGVLAVTLVYMDLPGSAAISEPHLQNDLDLKVTSPSGTTFYPNELGQPDRANNVERVRP
jgi:hypothetical protein